MNYKKRCLRYQPMILQYRPTASLEVTYEMYKNHKGIKILNLVSPKT